VLLTWQMRCSGIALGCSGADLRGHAEPIDLFFLTIALVKLGDDTAARKTHADALKLESGNAARPSDIDEVRRRATADIEGGRAD
jgi:hypothetical protein